MAKKDKEFLQEWDMPDWFSDLVMNPVNEMLQYMEAGFTCDVHNDEDLKEFHQNIHENLTALQARQIGKLFSGYSDAMWARFKIENPEADRYDGLHADHMARKISAYNEEGDSLGEKLASALLRGIKD